MMQNLILKTWYRLRKKEKKSGGERRKCSLLYLSFSLFKTDFILYRWHSWVTWAPRRAHIKTGRGKMRGAVEENSTAEEAHWTHARQNTAGEKGEKPTTHSQNSKVMSLVLRQPGHGKKHGHKVVLMGNIGMS